ncbi:pH-response regulator protein palH/RIM21 [Physcia stellaris]|nr:pH-response regulator protein palH/RIM21 [Physcia stellaris]
MVVDTNHPSLVVIDYASFGSLHTPSTVGESDFYNLHTQRMSASQDALFQPECSEYTDLNVSASGFNISVVDDLEPFYASTSPQIYAIAAATVVSYMLLIILFITPRTFFVGGAGGGGGFLGRRVSLTIASVDTFRIAELQYESGYQDATALTDAVADGLEIRIVRIISDTCLWLAQAQTLIRLFPRHKEKVIIKWTAFALILLDLIFSILNGFVYGNPKTRPRTFVDTVPALNYLFTIALSILYMAWVLYYSLSKRRFAFFHPKMRNIGLMAMLSLTAILIPVFFFVLDIAKPNVSGWGNYVRWVGAAAASVVVWEWVERIEALERDENKDGILGRELFDGDEMLEDTRSAGPPRGPGQNSGGGTAATPRARRKEGSGMGKGTGLGLTSIVTRLGRHNFQNHHDRIPINLKRRKRLSDNTVSKTNLGGGASSCPVQSTTPPTATVSPVSRADTTSATSTVYRIHYHPASVATPPIREAIEEPGSYPENSLQSNSGDRQPSQEEETQYSLAARISNARLLNWQGQPWQRVMNAFKRQRSSPPAEVSQALSTRSQMSDSHDNGSLPQATSRRSGILDKLRNKDRQKSEDLPITVIEWQPRGTAYLASVERQEHPPDSSAERIESSRQTTGKGKATDRPPDAVVNAVENMRRTTSTNYPPSSSTHVAPIAHPLRDAGVQDEQHNPHMQDSSSEPLPSMDVLQHSMTPPVPQAHPREDIAASLSTEESSTK